MNSLFSFPVGLFHPLQHAGLARRTTGGASSGRSGEGRPFGLLGTVATSTWANSYVYTDTTMALLHGQVLTRRWHDLVDASTTPEIAVAWITDCPAVVPLLQLAATTGKRLRVVTGVHDYLTSAKVLRQLDDRHSVKIGIADGPFKFHPKPYLFTKGEETVCWVGSANLTRSGFEGNIEVVHEFTDSDGAARDCFEALWARFQRPGVDWLRAYEERARCYSSARIPVTQMPAPQGPPVGSLSELSGAPCYRTVKLAKYSPPLLETAQDLLARIKKRIKNGNVSWSDGSGSVRLQSTREVVAKVLIYEAGLCRPCGGDWQDLSDGVYFLVRTDALSSEAIWTRMGLELEAAGLRRNITIALVPNYDKRFAYKMLSPGDDLDNVAILLGPVNTMSFSHEICSGDRPIGYSAPRVAF
jgi:HKD family nuclease